MQYTLKALRVNKGKTQEQAAKDLGIAVETLANYEKARTFPKIEMVKKIEKYYGTSYDDINFLCSKITVKQ